VTLYASIDDLQEAALNLRMPISGDGEWQQRLLDSSARTIDGYLGTSYDEEAVYAELDERQKDGLKHATCAQSIYVDQSGVPQWLALTDDISSSGAVSFFRPWTWPRMTPAVAEILSGLGLRAAAGSLCAAPSSWRYDPAEKFGPNGGAA
jgi:hypothetical protein